MKIAKRNRYYGITYKKYYIGIVFGKKRQRQRHNRVSK
jgi:hypothetical protein